MRSKLTDKSREVLDTARLEARGSACVGTHHILIALSKVRGNAQLLLESYKIGSENIVDEVKKFIDKGFKEPEIGTTNVGLSLRARNALEFAKQISLSDNQDAISTRHILYGIFKERLGIGSQALMALNITISEFAENSHLPSEESNNPPLTDSLKIKRDYESRLIKLRITYVDKNLPFAKREDMLERITELEFKLLTLKGLISEMVT